MNTDKNNLHRKGAEDAEARLLCERASAPSAPLRYIFLLLICVHLCSSVVNNSFAGSITTLDGKRIEGAVAVESAGALTVTPKDGSPTRVELSRVLEAQMDVSTPPTLTRGIVLTDGTALAAATFRRADDDTIKLVPAMMSAEVSVKSVRVARIVFSELTIVPSSNGATGVLLESGDFVEGDFLGLENGKAKISSVLFGIQSFEVGRPAKAVILRDAKAPSGNVIVRLVDGSVLPASSIVLDRAATKIEKTPFGTITVPFDQIAHLSAGGERVVSLATIKSNPSRSTESPTTWRLVGSTKPPGNAIAQTAGSSMTYELNGGYESFIAQVGVPAHVVPMQRVRITVTGDGRELFRSDERTSVDDALAIAVNVSGVKQLTLAVDVPGQKGASPAVTPPVLWSDPLLVTTGR
jgi:hypothetical protein